ncbi:2,3-bisphosphoglycerate-independent phosphoglycerate mutase [Alkalimonas collagenimarina]|uniref:2,3-bisphosphoglycerate-independent phosphoglycerate mutase n=1 Tax=Alkalimonas collagenimarina TaxID=400390 RepID=A0ABT9GVJ1_9GAMM|nr:2,3-bisphosphoglycerate-independent phosphoglycerate mutase [Alkalimonas collagenimarina]MDP4535064.1 2,3-bisphosphoglycerate-independent phosphoglycerate mutase [Alkalimonas collagenimarina]
MTTAKKPLVLMILDGWGHRESSESNAIAQANTPVMDRLWQQYPHTLISGSGMDVGLPEGQMGNSEVGHVNLGSGRVVYQDFTRVTKAIDDGDFFQNEVLVDAVQQAIAANGAVHVMGLLSPGGVHSHEDHILAMLELARQQGAKHIYLHAFLDGRDTPPRSAIASLQKIQDYFNTHQCGQIASIIGRYFAMDRDNRWDRVEQAYRLLTQGEAKFQSEGAVTALEQAYQRDENDEFVKATAILDAEGKVIRMQDGDSLVFMNFRADRARELSQAFTEPQFDGFEREVTPRLSQFATLTEYAADLKAAVAYPPVALNNVLGEWLAKHDKTQLRISETEKYAHVTFFFSGGREETFAGEERILIPSPQVATYDLQPEMSSEALTDQLIEAIQSGKYDVIVCNYPNGDMVGHTGILSAAIQAVEAVDHCIGRVVSALQQVGGECLITADHGNAEQMADAASGQAHTAHTSCPVPLIYVGRPATAASEGILSDIAPTMLKLMNMDIPSEMTGHALFETK